MPELAHQATVTDEADASRHVLRPRHHPCAHYGDAQPATRALPAGPLRGQPLPNIVVRPENDDAEFVETSWLGRELRIGDDVVLEITGHCPRCVMTTLPQGDLPKDSGILRTATRATTKSTSACMERCVAPGGSSEATP